MGAQAGKGRIGPAAKAAAHERDRPGPTRPHEPPSRAPAALGNQALGQLLTGSGPAAATAARSGPLAVSQPGDAEERRADARARAALRGQPAAASASGPARDHLPPGTPPVIAGQASSGRPLPDPGLHEARFGTPLRHVRIHDDRDAAELAEGTDARAFTIGSHVFFNRGEYRPRSPAGDALLTHELAHIALGHSAAPRLWRKRKGEPSGGEHAANPPAAQFEKEEWVRLQVFATGMDHAAQLLAQSNIALKGAENRTPVFVGLCPTFIKIYDRSGKPLGGRIALKEMPGLTLRPGIYVVGPNGLVALTVDRSDTSIGHEFGASIVGQRPLTKKEAADYEAELAKAKAENREPKPPVYEWNFLNLVEQPDRVRQIMAAVPNPLTIFFVPTIEGGATGKGGGETKTLYASPIELRGDGQPANAPPWPVMAEGPVIAPVEFDPDLLGQGRLDGQRQLQPPLAGDLAGRDDDPLPVGTLRHHAVCAQGDGQGPRQHPGGPGGQTGEDARPAH